MEGDDQSVDEEEADTSQSVSTKLLTLLKNTHSPKFRFIIKNVPFRNFVPQLKQFPPKVCVCMCMCGVREGGCGGMRFLLPPNKGNSGPAMRLSKFIHSTCIYQHYSQTVYYFHIFTTIG